MHEILWGYKRLKPIVILNHFVFAHFYWALTFFRTWYNYYWDFYLRVNLDPGRNYVRYSWMFPISWMFLPFDGYGYYFHVFVLGPPPNMKEIVGKKMLPSLVWELTQKINQSSSKNVLSLFLMIVMIPGKYYNFIVYGHRHFMLCKDLFLSSKVSLN